MPFDIKTHLNRIKDAKIVNLANDYRILFFLFLSFHKRKKCAKTRTEKMNEKDTNRLVCITTHRKKGENSALLSVTIRC